MAALNSDELADINTKDLEEWLKTQEEEAELLRRRVEENELIVRELRKIIAERKSQTATAIDTEDTPDDDSPKRAERSLVSTSGGLQKTHSLLIVRSVTRPKLGYLSETVQTRH